jgi:DNA-binding ferritin-like protein
MDRILSLSAFGDVIPRSKSLKGGIRSTSGGNKYAPIFKMVLQNSAQMKLLHWQSCLKGQHDALDKFFEEFLDLGDKLAEAIMGKYGRPVLDKDELMLCIQNYENPAEGDLSKFGEHLAKCYSTDCKSIFDKDKDPELINIVDEISALVEKNKYLLTLK